MTTRLNRIGKRVFAGGLVAAAPALVACDSGPSYDEWASTDGAAGRINLDDVQEAFKKSESPTSFERRVNEIYEGDGLVLVRAKNDGQSLVLEGWEDLNTNHEIDDASDDQLFAITQMEDKSHEMRGYGANSYYHSPFGGGSFLFGYMLGSTLGGPRGYYYSTPPTYARGGLTRQRNSYRGSSRYNTQVSKNSRYFTSKKTGFESSRYNAASSRQSTARSRYQSTQRSTGSFKSSGTGVRSSWGSSGGSRGSRGGGGFRGGGGGQVLIGATRPPSHRNSYASLHMGDDYFSILVQ